MLATLPSNDKKLIALHHNFKLHTTFTVQVFFNCGFLVLDYLFYNFQFNFDKIIQICFQFFIGWWIVIDASITYPSQEMMPHAVHACGAIGSVAFFMYVLINIIYRLFVFALIFCAINPLFNMTLFNYRQCMSCGVFIFQGEFCIKWPSTWRFVYRWLFGSNW